MAFKMKNKAVMKMAKAAGNNRSAMNMKKGSAMDMKKKSPMKDIKKSIKGKYPSPQDENHNLRHKNPNAIGGFIDDTHTMKKDPKKVKSQGSAMDMKKSPMKKEIVDKTGPARARAEKARLKKQREDKKAKSTTFTDKTSAEYKKKMAGL